MSMLDENCLGGLTCAETHILTQENVQNRNMSLAMKVSASRDPLRNISPYSLSRLCPPLRPLYFHLRNPVSALNLNYVGFDHICFHSTSKILWGDIFGDAPLRPADAFTPPRRPRSKRAKPPPLPFQLAPRPPPPPPPAAQATPLPGMHPPNLPHRPPVPSAYGRSVPLRAPAPASRFVPSPSVWQPAPSSSQLQPAAHRSTFHPNAIAQAPTIPSSLQPPATQMQRKQNKPCFLSFSDDSIESMQPRDHRVGSANVASAANAGVQNLPPQTVEGLVHAQASTAFCPPSSPIDFGFPEDWNFSESSSSQSEESE